MSEDTINTTLFTESPASWNTRYVTEDGFTCQLTLRADSGKELLERAINAMAHLREQGCTPFYGYSKGNGTRTASNSKNGSGNHWCPIHQTDLKRWEKNGKVWYSHKTDKGWCNGRG